MKARSVDKQFLTRDIVQQPRIYEIIDSQQIINLDYEGLMKRHNFSASSLNTAKYIVSTFKNGKVTGSLLKVGKYDYKSLVDEIKDKQASEVADILEQEAWNLVLPQLRRLCQVAMVMSRQYDVMITNPPYLGISKLEGEPKEYLINNYPDSKSDMFAMFMEANYVKKNGFRAIVNPDSWMFLVSFENLRKKIIKNEMVVNMIHIGMGEFDATVQTTSFVLRNAPVATNGVYFRLVDDKNKEEAFLAAINN